MNIAVGPNLPAMQAVSQGTQAIWDMLRVQISPFTSVITIDGHVFNSLTDVDKHWISAQYRAIVNVNVIYVHDTQMFRIFLARVDMFPPGSLIPVAAGNLAALMNPAMLGNRAPAVTARPDPRPQEEPDEGSRLVKHAKILRPPNAFILYRKAHHEAVKNAHPGIHNNQISVILGTQWQQEDAEVRAQYKAQAAQLKHEHMQKHPDYQYQPRKASELKRRMTKKKAAALSQNKAPLENLFDTDSSPSDHDFSGVAKSWMSIDLSSMKADCSNTTLFDQIHQHNTQQELNQFLEGSLPEVFVDDYRYKSLVSPHFDLWTEKGQDKERKDLDDFEEFINSDVWAGINTSS